MGKPKKKVSPKITSSVNRNIDELATREIVKAVKDAGGGWEIKDRRGDPHHPVAVTVSELLRFLFCQNG